MSYEIYQHPVLEVALAEMGFPAPSPKATGDWNPLWHKVVQRILTEMVLPHAGDATEVVEAVAALHAARAPKGADWNKARSDARNLAAEARKHHVVRCAAQTALWGAERKTAECAISNAIRNAVSCKMHSGTDQTVAYCQALEIVLEERRAQA